MWLLVVRLEYRKGIFICKTLLCQGLLLHEFGHYQIGYALPQTTLVQNLYYNDLPFLLPLTPKALTNTEQNLQTGSR